MAEHTGRDSPTHVDRAQASPDIKRKSSKAKHDNEVINEVLQLIKSLNHPNLRCFQDQQIKRGLSARVLVVNTNKSTLFKLVQGTPPDAFRTLNRDMMRSVAKKLRRGLQYLHEHSWYHGDLSAGTILFDSLAPNLRVLGPKAKVYISECATNTSSVKRYTRCGDLNFQSPESVLLQSGYMSRGHDIWMLGAVLMYMATGRHVVDYQHRFRIGSESYVYVDRFGVPTADMDRAVMTSFIEQEIKALFKSKDGYRGSVTRLARKFLRIAPEKRKLTVASDKLEKLARHSGAYAVQPAAQDEVHGKDAVHAENTVYTGERRFDSEGRRIRPEAPRFTPEERRTILAAFPAKPRTSSQ